MIVPNISGHCAPVIEPTDNAKPKTTQFVVINGKKIPKALYKPGKNFLIINSTNWTKQAITKILTTVAINDKSTPNASLSLVYNKPIAHENKPAITQTNVNAKPIPTAEDVFLEIPK